MRAITHAKAVLPGYIIEDCTILMDGERIAAVGKDVAIPEGTPCLDAKNRYVGPGFVDIHVHGGNKTRFDVDPVESSEYHLHFGTTSICAYLGYNLDVEETLTATKMIQKMIDEGKLPTVMGIGYEGPYINHLQGSGSRFNTRKGPDPEEYIPLYEACHGKVVQWMYAPEEDTDGKFGDFLRDKGITTAVGHSNATPAQIRAAVDKGATIATHLYDAMGYSGDYSDIGVTGTLQGTTAVGCLICPELTYEIIPDSLGMHVKPSDMRLAYQVGGPQRVAIITDRCPVDYDPADYPADHLRSIRDLNFNLDGELSGSMLTMDKAVRNFRKHTGASVIDLFQMASATPAKAVKVFGEVGSLTPGKYANMVIMDENLELEKVIFRGRDVE